METLKLNSDGKVVIPGLGTGKKKITIKQLSDKISHIPDTDSIDVDIDSKQGLLPPERVTSKNEYPYSITMNQGWANTMMGVPVECNGFIPDYIDTTNLTPGDRVYIIDPKHDDTSKYVLGDDRKWMYVGNYNDPEIGGVEGSDYSNIASAQGGMWLIRQNSKDNDIPIQFNLNFKQESYYGKGKVISDNMKHTGDKCFGYNHSAVWGWEIDALNDFKRIPSTTLTSDATINAIIQTHPESINGCWIWTKEDQDNGNEPIWKEETTNYTPELQNLIQVVEIYTGEEIDNKVKSNMIVNPMTCPIMINDLIFDGEIDKTDIIFIPNGTITPINLIYMNNKWRASYTSVIGGRPRTAFDYNVFIKPGMAFWYERRGTTPLTIRFPESV